ncbi:hypothetical protein OEZ85_010980 [Tetradesmus obliquus]|uniref:FPL domain-containing protein n=1 Tax=Tetradesmus obliquus TaxID=3088 RepID=A0ABY8TP86_TETOB|nr:hypothetical protein OEZ85_010980 [Tetradesmus obliquus]
MQQLLIEVVFLLAEEEDCWTMDDVVGRRLTLPAGVLLAASEKLAAQAKHSGGTNVLELVLDNISQLPVADYMLKHVAQQAVPMTQHTQVFLCDLLLLADKHGFLALVEEVQGVMQQQLQQQQHLEDGLADALCKLCPLPCVAWQLVLEVVKLLLLAQGQVIASSTANVEEQAATLLAQVFDDLEVVWSEPDSSRRAMLCALPLQQLQILLSLGGVRVASEDTVLFTLASIGATTTTTAAAVQSAVRIMHLSPEALMLLPSLTAAAAHGGSSVEEQCFAALYTHYIVGRYDGGVWVIDGGEATAAAGQRPRSCVEAVTLEFCAPVALLLEKAEQAVSRGIDMTLAAAPAEGTANPVFAGRHWQARFLVYQKQDVPRAFGLGLEVQPTFPGGRGVLWCPGRSGISVQCRDRVTVADGPWVHKDFELLQLLPGIAFADAAGLAAHLGQQLLRVSMHVRACE